MTNSRVLNTEYWPKLLVQESLLHAFLVQHSIHLQGLMLPLRNFYLKTILQNTENFQFQNLQLTTEQNAWRVLLLYYISRFDKYNVVKVTMSLIHCSRLTELNVANFGTSTVSISWGGINEKLGRDIFMPSTRNYQMVRRGYNGPYRFSHDM